MVPGTYNTQIKQGDDFARTFDFTNKDGTPFTDFTTWTSLQGQVRKLPTDTGTPIAVITVVPGSPTYRLNISMARAITSAIPVDKASTKQPNLTTRYYFDFEGIDPVNGRQTLVAGYVDVIPEVTK